MKVRIIKSSHWHTGKIGQVFNVVSPGYRREEDGYIQVADRTSRYDGYGLFKGDYEIVVEDKIVEHDDVKYIVKSWANHLTRDGSGKDIFAWEKMPVWKGDGRGYWHDSEDRGKCERAKQYVEPTPEGNFIVRV